VRVTWLAVLLTSALSAATAQKQSSGPRAVAVVQAGPQGPLRLLPVAIMVEGRFYDASIYRASPVPMALDPGTVYEVMQAGESIGLFTIRTPAQTANRNWSATGQFEDKHALEAAQAKRPSVASAPQGQKADAEDRPVLRKNPRKDTSASSPPSTPAEKAPTTAPPPTASSGSNPPSLHGEAQAGAPSLHSGTNPSASTAETESQAPDRPILHRGAPEPERADTKPSAPERASSRSPGSKSKIAPARLMPAISDADGPEPRPYYFVPKPGEEAEFQRKVTQMAQQEIAKYEQARRSAFASAQITPQEFRMFDLDSSNQPIFVLSATAKIFDRGPGRRPGRGRPDAAATQPAPDAFLTVVAHEDVYGELQPMFATVTDAQHLDEFPRLQLVDAVDADGDGRGELLFQKASDSGPGWIIYKPGPDKLATLYDSSNPQ
jgi:hypothetical protein